MSISEHSRTRQRPPNAPGWPAAELPGTLLAEISRTVVGIHRERFGRGPTRAKAHFDGELLVVVLGEVLTPMERSLAAAGMGEKVTELRALASLVVQDELEAAVGTLVARPAKLTASQVLPDCDIGTHVFTLSPAPAF